jgi:lysozyme
MDISTKGLIEIMSHEGVCLSPYLDSVGVWTIGVGITAHDGADPKTMGPITIDQAIAMFKDRIRAYVAPVQRLRRTLTQEQFDALVSFCYNVGPGNLEKLCRNRSNAEIGEAFSLYNKPPEIIGRRSKEQRLFKEGVYSGNGKVIVFPVSANHQPIYKQGYQLDVAKYFNDGAAPAPAPAAPAAKPVPAKPAGGLVATILNLILGLFKK